MTDKVFWIRYKKPPRWTYRVRAAGAGDALWVLEIPQEDAARPEFRIARAYVAERLRDDMEVITAEEELLLLNLAYPCD